MAIRKHTYTCFIILLLFASLFCKASVNEDLEKLRKKDNLIDWIDLRITYAIKDPQKNLDFLLDSEKQLWRKPQNAEEQTAWLYLLINEAYYLLNSSNITQSINKYEEAYDYFLKHQLNIDVEEFILKPLGNNYTRIGDYERAVFILNKSLALAKNEKRDTITASIYNNLAISYRTQQNLDKALFSVKQGLNYCKPNNRIYGILYATYTDILFDLQQEDEALKTAKVAIHTLEKKQNTLHWLASAKTIMANIYLHQKKLKEASIFYDEAVVLLKKDIHSSRKRELAYIYTQKSILNNLKNDPKSALNDVDQALSLLIEEYKVTNTFPTKQQLYPENRLQLALYQKATVLSDLGRYGEALNGYKLAFETSEQLRSDYTYNSSKKKLQDEAKDIAEKIIETSYLLWQRTNKKIYSETILEISEKTKGRILLDDLMARQEKIASSNKTYADIINLEKNLAYLEKQKRVKSNKEIESKIEDLRFQISSLKKNKNISNYSLDITAQEMISKIPDQTDVIIFFVGKKKIYCCYVTNKGIQQIKTITNASQFESETLGFLDSFYFHGPQNMINSPKSFYSASQRLSQTIFKDLNLNNNHQLWIVKDGILNFISFDGLIMSGEFNNQIRNWPFLIKQKSITYKYSLFQFAEAQDKTVKSFSGFFLSNTENGSIEIPSVNLEYTKLKQIISGNFYKNERATLTNFKESLNESDIIHISSHAYVGENKDEPVLELFKDKFYMFETGLSAHIPSLVILNACQTADGKYINGEGVESLGRSFLATGSHGVISSLWPINDESGANVLISFYQHLETNNSPQQSLRLAKLEWINNLENPKIMALPYYWDSLVYTGSDLQVSLNRAFGWMPYALILACLTVIIISYFLRRNLIKQKI